MIQKTFSRILGCALLLCGNTALAFTLPPDLQPSNAITNSYTAETQVQPIAGTIRGQILSQLRPRNSKKTTQLGGMMLAANAYSNNNSDVTYLAAANDSSYGAGSGGSGGGGNSDNLWISNIIDSLENTFSRTAFHGMTQNVIFGYDVTRSNQYVFGVSGGYESSKFTTSFNAGDERTQGGNINPYFAWLMSDTWSLDLIGGYGKFNTHQSRTMATGALATIAVTSKFQSERSFVSSNLTNVSALGAWRLTGSLGYLRSTHESDAYTESIGIPVEALKRTSKQWNLLGEVAYGRGNSETFFGARYEKILDLQDVVLTAGEQPTNDPTSVLLNAGWRYFGKDLSANFAFHSRVGQEDVRGYGFSMLLRVGL